MVAAPKPGHGELDLVGGVLHDLAAELHGCQQRDTARLPDRHRGPGVGLEEDPFDDDDVGVKLADELVQLATKRREPARYRFVDGGRDHTGRDGVPVRPVRPHAAVAAP